MSLRNTPYRAPSRARRSAKASANVTEIAALRPSPGDHCIDHRPISRLPALLLVQAAEREIFHRRPSPTSRSPAKFNGSGRLPSILSYIMTASLFRQDAIHRGNPACLELFENPDWSIQTQRVIAEGAYGGADVFEVVRTARTIAAGNVEAWCTGWLELAEGVPKPQDRRHSPRVPVDGETAAVPRIKSISRRARLFYARDRPAQT